MIRRFSLSFLSTVFILFAFADLQTVKAEQQLEIDAQFALVDRYCVTCHNAKTQAGGLILDKMDLSKVVEHADVWEKVIRKLRAGMMPPPGLPRPDVSVQDAFVSYLEIELDRVAQVHPNPGRTETFHRLNRAEYQNVVRDWLAVDIDVTALLPPDDAGYGFDNIAGVLKLSQSLMERYLATARKISRIAVGGSSSAPVADTFPVSTDQLQYDRVEDLPFGTRGGMRIQYHFPRDAEYTIRAEFTCALVEVAGCDPVAGYDDTHQLEFTVDGRRVHLFTLQPRAKGGKKYKSFVGEGEEQTTTDMRWNIRVPVSAGLREVGVSFLKLSSYETSDYARLRFDAPSYEGNMVPEGLGVYQPHISSVTIAGPFNAQGGPGDTPSRQRIFTCLPTQVSEEIPCAEKILSTLARRAYRRPVTDADLQALFTFYDVGRAEGGFESGIEMALRALLMSKDFLFRMEHDPDPISGANSVASIYRLSDLELASRLSFFLWSSIPDDELLDLAVQGKLQNTEILEEQVRRMLADSRSNALATNFLPQWLQLRGMDAVSPAEPDFDETLREAMKQETKLFFGSIVQEDHPVTELVTANYTFLNERLAWHYRIPNVKGSHFRRVVLSDDSPRRGLLGQGSVLTVTSHAIRTSPVKRGKWILESMLGVSPPPPPPNVPPLDEKTGGKQKVLSMRERMAAHRENPVCAACHSMIDPVGFALENFDPTGRYRIVDEAMKPIDASGSFPGGARFGGLNEFRDVLARRPEQFVSALTDRLLTYALGRGLEYYDMPTVRAITQKAANDEYRFSSLVLGIVNSVPFQMRNSTESLPRELALVGP